MRIRRPRDTDLPRRAPDGPRPGCDGRGRSSTRRGARPLPLPRRPQLGAHVRARPRGQPALREHRRGRDPGLPARGRDRLESPAIPVARRGGRVRRLPRADPHQWSGQRPDEPPVEGWRRADLAVSERPPRGARDARACARPCPGRDRERPGRASPQGERAALPAPREYDAGPHLDVGPERLMHLREPALARFHRTAGGGASRRRVDRAASTPKTGRGSSRRSARRSRPGSRSGRSIACAGSTTRTAG